MIHMVEAFRDTTLSNVWQLAASLKEKKPPNQQWGVNHPTFPNLSKQTINFQTIPNYQHRLLSHIGGTHFSTAEFQPFFPDLGNLFKSYYCCLKNDHAPCSVAWWFYLLKEKKAPFCGGADGVCQSGEMIYSGRAAQPQFFLFWPDAAIKPCLSHENEIFSVTKAFNHASHTGQTSANI